MNNIIWIVFEIWESPNSGKVYKNVDKVCRSRSRAEDHAEAQQTRRELDDLSGYSYEIESAELDDLD